MTIRTSTARRERVRELARRDILESAARVFARRGYAAATLAELAEAAGYAAPSLYRYFGSKEEIFDSLIALVSAELQEAFDAPVDRSLPLPARLSALFVALHQLAEGRRETLDLLAAHADFGERQAHFEGLLQAWLHQHVGRAELRVPPALAARVAAGVLLALDHGRGRTGMTSGEMSRVAADLILHGVSE
jgi:AcrR family transcriptional regulator